MKINKMKNVIVITVISLIMSACATNNVVEVPVEKEEPLTSENWSEIIPEKNIAIVLFDPTGEGWLGTRYQEMIDMDIPGIEYLKFTFSDEKKDKSIARVTPAIHLYKEGFLIDKISGSPKNYQEAVDFDRDMRLWMDTTVNRLKYNDIAGITYKFNGNYLIDIRVFQ